MSFDPIKLYTTKQAAEALGMGTRFIRDQIRSGRLKALIHRGSKGRKEYRIQAVDLQSFIWSANGFNNYQGPR